MIYILVFGKQLPQFGNNAKNLKTTFIVNLENTNNTIIFLPTIFLKISCLWKMFTMLTVA